jgi:hypothetical protein
MVNYKQKFLKYKLKYQKIRQTGGVNCGLLNENDCKDNPNECKWNPVIKECSKITTRFKNIEPSFNLDYEDGGEFVLDQTFDVERNKFYNETETFKPREDWNQNRSSSNASVNKFNQYYKDAEKDTGKPKLVRCQNCEKGKKNCLCLETYPEESDEFGDFIVVEDRYTPHLPVSERMLYYV